MCPGNLTREPERGALIRCLSRLTWLHSMQSRDGSIDVRASHISEQKPRHPIFWSLVFVISFLRLLPIAFDHRWAEERLSTGKFRAFPFSFFTTMCHSATRATSVRSWFIMSEVRVWLGFMNSWSGLCLLQVKLFCWLHNDPIFQSLYCGLYLGWKSAPSNQRPWSWLSLTWRDQSRSGITSFL